MPSVMVVLLVLALLACIGARRVSGSESVAAVDQRAADDSRGTGRGAPARVTNMTRFRQPRVGALGPHVPVCEVED